MRGQGCFEPANGFGETYRRFFDIDLGQSFGWFEHDGQRFACQRFDPAGAVAGSVIVVHGYYDHVGLYGHLIRYLLGRGLRVYAYDQQGHGLSTGPRATIDSFDRYVRILAAFVRANDAALAHPRWAIGQSMGASVILEMLDAGDSDTRTGGPHTRRRAEFDYVVLLAPLVRPAAWYTSRVAYALGRHFLNEVQRKFAPNTENPEFSALVRSDPLQARVLPVEWVTAMLNWKRSFEARRPSQQRIVVIQGGRDRTVDAKYNIKLLHRRYPVTLLRIPEARHHLVNETARIRRQMWHFLDSLAKPPDPNDGVANS